MAEEIHPGSFVGDTIEEFKKMPPAGKWAAAIAVVAVAGLALYLKSRQGATASTSAPGASTGTTGGFGNLPPTDMSGGTATPPPGPPGTQGPPGQPGPPGPQGPPIPIDPGPGIQPKPVPTPPKVSTHVVQHGENLSEIASSLHIKGGWQAIYNNGNNKQKIGPNPNLIHSGLNLDLTGLV